MTLPPIKQPSNATRVRIRWAIRRDMPEVLAIESESFSYPKTEDEILTHLRQRDCIGMVAELNTGSSEIITAFMMYEMHKSQLNIIDFAVHPAYRRSSIGRQMAEKLIGKLSSYRRTKITTLLRETNLDGLLFFKSMGFEAVNLVIEHFDDEGCDGIAMVYEFKECQGR